MLDQNTQSSASLLDIHPLYRKPPNLFSPMQWTRVCISLEGTKANLVADGTHLMATDVGDNQRPATPTSRPASVGPASDTPAAGQVGRHFQWVWAHQGQTLAEAGAEDLLMPERGNQRRTQ